MVLGLGFKAKEYLQSTNVESETAACHRG